MTADLSITALLSMYALMLIPLAVFFYLQLGIIRDTVLALVRMTVQLLLVGLYLKYIFQLNNPFVSLLWLAVMLVVATISILGKAGLKRGPFFWRSLAGITVSTLFVSGWFILVAIRPDPVYDVKKIRSDRHIERLILAPLQVLADQPAFRRCDCVAGHDLASTGRGTHAKVVGQAVWRNRLRVRGRIP